MPATAVDSQPDPEVVLWGSEIKGFGLRARRGGANTCTISTARGTLGLPGYQNFRSRETDKEIRVFLSVAKLDRFWRSVCMFNVAASGTCRHTNEVRKWPPSAKSAPQRAIAHFR